MLRKPGISSNGVGLWLVSVNLCSFNLHRDYSNSLTLSNISEIFSKNNIDPLRKRKKFSLSLVDIKREIRQFHVVVSGDGKEMYKKVFCCGSVHTYARFFSPFRLTFHTSTAFLTTKTRFQKRFPSGDFLYKA